MIIGGTSVKQSVFEANLTTLVSKQIKTLTKMRSFAGAASTRSVFLHFDPCNSVTLSYLDWSDHLEDRRGDFNERTELSPTNSI